MTFGPDLVSINPVTQKKSTRHTLFVGNDNDFLGTLAPPVGTGDNPNQFFVFSFADSDLPGFVPQPFDREHDDRDHGDHGHGDRD